MRRNRRSVSSWVLALGLLFGSTDVLAQDTQLWTVLGAEGELAPDLTLGYGGHLRVTDDVTSVSRFMHQLTLGYDLGPVELAAAYRLVTRPSARRNSCCRHRVHADVKGGVELGPVALSLRLRGQYTDGPHIDPRAALRLRLQARWRATKGFRPFFAYEPFLRFDDDGTTLRTHRFTLGVQLRKGRLRVRPYLRVEFESDRDDAYIGGLSVALRY